MYESQQKTGMHLVWWWSDKEIEKPNLLKAQLEDIQSKGFIGVLACLGRTRYELIDRKVVRAATQASQWAKIRGIAFWLQADPRRASRSMITLTGERTQNLLASREHDGHYHLNLIRIRKNRFVMRIPYPKAKMTPLNQEVFLSFEPSGLERAFLLQIENGKILNRTVRDITGEARFFTNGAEHYVEIFGEIQVPEGETWYVMAFPRFDTDLFDYAGRKSVDQLMPFIESLFDSGLYLDGLAWEKPCTCGNAGRLTVGPSFYNAFISEYGYDLREHLPALVIDFDDESHIPVRNDYTSLLMQSVFGAQRDFLSMLHAFFGDIETLMPHAFQTGVCVSEYPVCGIMDPWQGLLVASAGLAELELQKPLHDHLDANLSMLVRAKSLGVFSKSQRAYVLLKGFDYKPEELNWWMDVTGMFSLRWMVKGYGAGSAGIKKIDNTAGYPEHPGWASFSDYNLRYDAIARITGFKLPESDTLLVLPTETVISSNSARAQEILSDIDKLIGRLVVNGNQLDAVSSAVLKKATMDRHGLHFRNRVYQCVIYPYPEVLNPEVLELVSLMEKTGFPILLGGTKPKWTCEGKKIPHDLPVAFDPRDEAFAKFWQTGIERMFQVPENGLGSIIQTGMETLLLFCPKETGGHVEGQARYDEIKFQVSRSQRLAIYSLKNGKVEKVF